MTSNTPPKDFVQVPDPAAPGNSRYLGPAAGLVTTSWEDGVTTVHVDVEENLTVEQARQLLADLGEVLAKLEGAE
ncbi:hypothetical protein [Arthrobacter mobilis]|uniref:Uncharacterized protein n=1 Tax=Arthrobacter mobilis TaxID=2724944 RepID=A0A7X6HE14_9MICC|nr:hypothetical protein [Arthrobacter mobilis]NKX55393.1 hypothetical protein [Arthrobacter mobilis]